MSNYTLSEKARAVIDDVLESLPELPGISMYSFIHAANKLDIPNETSYGRTIFKRDESGFWIPNDKMEFSWKLLLLEGGMSVRVQLRIPYEGYDADDALYQEVVDKILEGSSVIREAMELPLAEQLIIPNLPFLKEGTIEIITNEEFEASGLPSSFVLKESQAISLNS